MAEYEDDPDDQMIMDDDEDGGVEPPVLVAPPAKPPLSKHSPQQRSTKPWSTSALSATSLVAGQAQASTDMHSASKPKSEAKSNTNMMRAVSVPTEEKHVCPICSKVFRTDNASLNEHVDFCLSKGAILAATAVPGKERRRLS